MIQVFQPSLGKDELEAVREVFESNWLGRGRRVAEFERQFAGHRGVAPESMIATTCASEGLFTAAEVLGWAPGDEVVVPSISFVAAAAAAARVGAVPIFCDVDPRTLNATLHDIEQVVTPRTKAVSLNHYGGYPAAVGEIAEFCRARGLSLVEDAACAVASTVGDRAVGTFGDVGVWSFDAMKVLVTGDGGMVYAREPGIARATRQAMYLGLPLEEKSGVEKSKSMQDRWWEFEIESFGRRAIMNDLTAAIGLVQLDRLPAFLRRRAEIAARYDEGLARVPGLRTPPKPAAGVRVTDYLYWVQSERRDELARHLLDHGIYTTFRYWPLHRVKMFGHGRGPLPGAERAAKTTLNLPCHQSMTDGDVERVVELIVRFLK